MSEQQTKPFWAVEYEYKKLREQLESDCIEARTLQDAIICGANMTYLDGQKVGYMEVDEIFELEEPWQGKCLSDVKVVFEKLDEDEDGYTVAYFKRETI